MGTEPCTEESSKASETNNKNLKMAPKSGMKFVIPKNKLSGSLVPIARGSGKADATNATSDGDSLKSRRKTKWGVDLTQDPAVKRGRALALQTRAEQIAAQLEMGNLEADANELPSSPSPPPIYDSNGQRTNTREERRRERLELEKREAIGECMLLNPSYKPPPGYKPILKEDKLYIPVKEYPGYNFIGQILGPRGNTQKQIEMETGAKIAIHGKGAPKEVKSARSDVKDVEAASDELHVYITADSNDKVEAAVALVRPLLIPIGEGEANEQQLLKELEGMNGTMKEGIFKDLGSKEILSSQGKVFGNDYVKFMEDIRGGLSTPGTEGINNFEAQPAPPGCTPTVPADISNSTGVNSISPALQQNYFPGRPTYLGAPPGLPMGRPVSAGPPFFSAPSLNFQLPNSDTPKIVIESAFAGNIQTSYGPQVTSQPVQTSQVAAQQLQTASSIRPTSGWDSSSPQIDNSAKWPVQRPPWQNSFTFLHQGQSQLLPAGIEQSNIPRSSPMMPITSQIPPPLSASGCNSSTSHALFPHAASLHPPFGLFPASVTPLTAGPLHGPPSSISQTYFHTQSSSSQLAIPGPPSIPSIPPLAPQPPRIPFVTGPHTLPPPPPGPFLSFPRPLLHPHDHPSMISQAPPRFPGSSDSHMSPTFWHSEGPPRQSSYHGSGVPQHMSMTGGIGSNMPGRLQEYSAIFDAAAPRMIHHSAPGRLMHSGNDWPRSRVLSQGPRVENAGTQYYDPFSP